MCIAIYSPEGTQLPSRNKLKICWHNNDDGAGYMQIKDGLCHIKKGFMKFKHFWKSYQAEGFTESDSVVIHFRIGTSGKMDQTCTHPFPISNSVSELKSLEITSKYAFVHNGIVGRGDVKKGLSDTMVFTIEVLDNLKEYLDDKKILDTVANITAGSRFLIVSKGTVWLTGSWITDKKTGIYYSNDGYKKKSVFISYGTDFHSGYAWDEDSSGKWSFKRAKELNFDKQFDESNFDDTDLESIPYCPQCETKGQVFQFSDNNIFECYDCGIEFNEDSEIIKKDEVATLPLIQ